MRRAVRTLTLMPLMLAFACSASGKRSTPGSRIEDNRKLFHTYPPSVQKAIRLGRIQRGFDQTKVYMALGEATAKETAGASETWLYAKRVRKKVTTDRDADQDESERRRNKATRGRSAKASSTDEAKYLQRTRVVRVVEFKHGRVSSWEDPSAHYLDEWHE